jgi:alanine racemase
LVEAAGRGQDEGGLLVVGLFSQFACAYEPGHESVDAQLAAFHHALEVAAGAGLRPQVRHMANSAATLTRPDAHFDLVRVGIAAYGLNPVPEVGDTGLRPAMTLAAPVALAKRAGPGQGVSYGLRYTTASETTLALIPLGYGDGIPRHATNLGPVAIGGRRFTVAGTVCMDQFVVDVGDAPVEAGSRAVLFGPGEEGEPTAQEWAEILGTIHYEIVTRIAPRVPRRYVGG